MDDCKSARQSHFDFFASCSSGFARFDARVWSADLVLAVKVSSGVIAAWLITQLMNFQFHHFYPVPFLDGLLDLLRFYVASGTFSKFLKYLITPHNEHVIATTRLIALADKLAWHGRGHLQVLCSYTFQIGGAIIAYRVFRPASIRHYPIDRLWTLSCLLLFFLNANFLFNFAIGFQVQHFIMAFLVILTASHISNVPLKPDLSKMQSFVIAQIGLAVVATFTLGNAPVLLIAATAMAIILRWNPRWIVILAVLAVAHIVLTLAIIVYGGEADASEIVGSHTILPMIAYVLLYLGSFSPFTRLVAWPSTYITWWGSPYLGALLGMTLMAIAIAFTVIRLYRPNWGGRVGTFGLVLMIVVVITAAAAAYTRTNTEGILDGTNSKYASWSALGWLGAFMIVAGAMREQYGDLRRVNTTAVAATMLIFYHFRGQDTIGRLESGRSR